MLAAAVLMAAAAGGFFWLNSSEVTIPQKVGRLIELPSDEQPTIVTVSDKDKLAGQLFFLNAQDGDKVLIFPKAGKAILYRPSEDKIIEVGVVNSDKWSPLPAATPTPPSGR